MCVCKNKSGSSDTLARYARSNSVSIFVPEAGNRKRVNRGNFSVLQVQKLVPLFYKVWLSSLCGMQFQLVPRVRRVL